MSNSKQQLSIENLLSGTCKKSNIIKICIYPQLCMMFFINTKVESIKNQEMEEFSRFVSIPYMHKHTEYTRISYSNLESVESNAQLRGLFLHKYFNQCIEYWSDVMTHFHLVPVLLRMLSSSSQHLLSMSLCYHND